MTDVSIGDRHKFHMMALRCPQGRYPATLVLSIIWVRAETYNSQLAVIFLDLIRKRGESVHQKPHGTRYLQFENHRSRLLDLEKTG